MPYLSSSIPLTGMQDRRRKLNDEDREEILFRYNHGASQRSLALQYGVNKNSIRLIVDPAYRARRKEYTSEHWRDHRPAKEEWAAIMREHRHYKQTLYLEGKLVKEE